MRFFIYCVKMLVKDKKWLANLSIALYICIFMYEKQ